MAEYKPTELITFDFDGVIHNNCYTECASQVMETDSDFGSLLPDSLEFMKYLQDLGLPLVIMSARKKRSIKKWLEKQPVAKKLKLKFRCLPFWVRRYDDVGVIGITNTKMIAKLYIDDRSIHFDGKFTEKFKKDVVDFQPWHKK
ncbi:MAG: hypothetical protein LBU68_03090 [Rickettsiales bacterium]|jgi:hypothetical protein|nr:hypothetical protein [Rickettsiales bacterium]